ncbi:MAG TPA: hypothetical protein PK364_11330, partial [Synergistaceae bacterium]|nr:hypothetical protein [Synergistaceae bacterium]
RTPPLELGSFLRGGVTSAVGLLGTDGIARSLEELLLKARGLEEEGISTWILWDPTKFPLPPLREAFLGISCSSTRCSE